MLITDEEKSSAVRDILLFKSLLFVKSFNFKARVHELMANVGCYLIWVDFLKLVEQVFHPIKYFNIQSVAFSLAKEGLDMHSNCLLDAVALDRPRSS